jgi:hypothetical protein
MSVFFVILLWLFVGILWAVKRGNRTDAEAVFERPLSGYASLKLPGQKNPSDEMRFAILLGILKKVETKNGVMATIWAIMIAALAILSQATNKENEALDIALMAYSAPFLFLSILGTRQLDNYSSDHIHTEEAAANSPWLHTYAASLRTALVKDALLKEEMLFISQKGAQVLIVLGSLLWIYSAT